MARSMPDSATHDSTDGNKRGPAKKKRHGVKPITAHNETYIESLIKGNWYICRHVDE